MTAPAKYRKKPVTIEAMQFDGTKESANDILGWIGTCGGLAKRTHRTKPERGLTIATLEGDMHAAPGWWIIRGVQGEFYPCKPDIFTATYEAEENTITIQPLTDERPRIVWATGGVAPGYNIHRGI